jgi:hypothetical protein
MSPTLKVASLVIGGAVLVAPVAPLFAQDTTQVVGAPVAQDTAARAVESIVIRSPLDTLPVSDVIVVRPGESIRQDLAQARAEERRAGQAAETAKQEHRRRGVEIQIVKRDIDALKPRIDLAKDQGQAGEQASLEEKKKKMEAQVRSMERMRELIDTERKLAEARRDHSRARVAATEAELRLADQRRRLTDLNRPPLADRDYSKAAIEVLKLQKAAAARGKAVSSQEEALADRRQKAFEEQSKWLTTVTGVELK